MNDVNIWIKGLVAAAIGGAANAVTMLIVDPQQFNFTDGLSKLGSVAGVGALLSVAMYLQKSPIWSKERA
jgi:hypothetical protein